MKTEFLFATPLIVVEPFRRQADVALGLDPLLQPRRVDGLDPVVVVDLGVQPLIGETHYL